MFSYLPGYDGSYDAWHGDVAELHRVVKQQIQEGVEIRLEWGSGDWIHKAWCFAADVDDGRVCRYANPTRIDKFWRNAMKKFLNNPGFNLKVDWGSLCHLPLLGFPRCGEAFCTRLWHHRDFWLWSELVGHGKGWGFCFTVAVVFQYDLQAPLLIPRCEKDNQLMQHAATDLSKMIQSNPTKLGQKSGNLCVTVVSWRGTYSPAHRSWFVPLGPTVLALSELQGV